MRQGAETADKSGCRNVGFPFGSELVDAAALRRGRRTWFERIPIVQAVEQECGSLEEREEKGEVFKLRHQGKRDGLKAIGGVPPYYETSRSEGSSENENSPSQSLTCVVNCTRVHESTCRLLRILGSSISSSDRRTLYLLS